MGPQRPVGPQDVRCIGASTCFIQVVKKYFHYVHNYKITYAVRCLSQRVTLNTGNPSPWTVLLAYFFAALGGKSVCLLDRCILLNFSSVG